MAFYPYPTSTTTTLLPPLALWLFWFYPTIILFVVNVFFLFSVSHPRLFDFFFTLVASSSSFFFLLLFSPLWSGGFDLIFVGCFLFFLFFFKACYLPCRALVYTLRYLFFSLILLSYSFLLFSFLFYMESSFSLSQPLSLLNICWVFFFFFSFFYSCSVGFVYS